ncbi:MULTISPECIES: hypothetical protein [Pseudomonas syringae group]|uniref:Uncharacterized protein n=2 Tax=Pseudomonas viridiflava TaxID=33069 RepID=A0A1Y6JIH2_PSEVI|nr:hypothetical protein [Pseudomonas viridiflava]MCF8977392.1 hypothetical protein [Pseudomonas syringae]VVM57456.1 hypothetical protein PS634_01128 [Pseudomonas fluorescens]MBV1806553.1 hypothetical protein [Pseudomonas viridiflava]MCI3910872.1 hypothetical protein [Pseudomonas viridiflava]MEE4074298.1 hypothetical protein [Pseudomonas viridiflava]
MGTTARTYLLTPALWRTLTAPKISQAPSPEPLLFLSQGVLHDSQLLGQVKLRTIQELPTLEALITVYIEGMETTLTTTAPIIDARLYATTQDIIHQNDAFNSVIFKVVSYSEQAVTSDIYLWEIPSPIAPDAIESDLPLYLPKGSTFHVSQSEQDIVMDRTIRISEEHQASVNIRTVEGRSYSTTITEAQAARCAIPGDYYVESGSGRLAVVYGVTTAPEPPFTPIIKYIPLPDGPAPT